jgi:uncharacterized protein
MSMLLWTALLLGVAGSLHCVGMCGPIALSLPIAHMGTGYRIRGILAYNFGRAATYSVLGALSGLIGGTIHWVGGQQTLSIVAGVVILVALLVALTGKRIPFVRRFDKYYTWLRTSLGNLFRQRTTKALLLIGLLNGLLPCGLVFAALGGAAATGSVLQGATFMFVFGLGTIPAMFSLSFAAVKMSDRFRNKLHRVVPIFVTAMALLLILRGMGLGIPYVSPSFEKDKSVCCHR